MDKCFGKSVGEINSILTTTLTNGNTWLVQHGLKLNTSKTKCLIDLDSKMTLSMYCKQRIIQLYFERKVSYRYIVTDWPMAKSPVAHCNLHIFLSGL